MKALQSKSLKKPIISIEILEDKQLIVVDSETTVRYFERGSFELQGGFKVNIVHEEYKTELFRYSGDGNFFVTLSADAKESRLYNSKTKKIITKFDRHQGRVSCVGIDPLSRYMFSCGDDGKVFAIDLKSGKLVFTLPVHVDAVNAIACSQNANWVATVSYDKKISLFNLATMNPKEKLRIHSEPVMHVRFFHNNKLITIDKSASAIIWSMSDEKIIGRLKGIHDDVTKLTISSDEKFLFIGTALGYILVYDLETYTLLSSKYIKLSSAITAMAFDAENNHLLVGTHNGNVLIFDIYQGEEELKELLLKKDFQSIQEATKENPILEYTQVYGTVLALWEKTFQKAKVALENGDQERALALLVHFKHIPSKNSIIQKTIKDYADFEKFKLYVSQGKLPLAYSVVNQHPAYKESKIYKHLEQTWQKAFLQAQKLLMTPRGLEQAKEILLPYRGVSEKTKLIQELLTQSEVYKRFRSSISQKEFLVSFDLLKQHQFLYEFPEYTMLTNYGDTLYIKIEQFLEEGDTHGALRLLRILVDFPDFSEEVKELTRSVESRQRFFQAIEEDDLITAYNMLESIDDLQESEDGKRLQTLWNDDLKRSSEYASNGDSKGLQESLAKYMKVSSKYMSIGTIFGWCYIVQLEDAVANQRAQKDIENGIKNYMLCFGLQDQIENFYGYFKSSYLESKLSLEFLTQGSLSMWRPSMIVDSILD